MNTRTKAPSEISEGEARRTVTLITNVMHLLPDKQLTEMVDRLTGEMRRRGLIRDFSADDEDQVPF